MQPTAGGARAEEAEQVDIPSWPKLSQCGSWRLNAVESVVAAPAVPDQAFSWMLEADADSATFEKLASSEVVQAGWPSGAMP